MITEEERQRVIDTYNSQRMAKLGRSRSPKKRRAALANLKLALAKRLGRPLPKKKKR